MATSMMQNKKSSTWTTVKSKSDDKKKRTEEKKKQEVVEDRLGVAVPKKNVFAAMDSAWQKKVEQASVKVEEATPYAGAFTGLVVEQVTLDDPESPATPPNSDRQPSTEISERQIAEPKMKKPKKVKPSALQVAQGLSIAALQASFQEWEQRYEGNEVAELEMLADFFSKSFKECELQFNNILTEKSLEKATEVPLSDIPADFSSAVQAFLDKKHTESLKSLVLLLTTVTFEGLPEGLKSKTGVAPPKAKVGLLTLLALVLRVRPQALLAAAPDLLLLGRNYTAPGRIPQLLWVLNQAATVSPSAAVAVWSRLVLPQLLGSEAYAKKPDTADLKIPIMDASAHSPVLDYLESLLSKQLDPDVELGPNTLQPTIPGSAVEAVSQSCFAEAYSGPTPAQTRTRLQTLFPRFQALAAASNVSAHFSEWLPLALETAASSSGGFEGVGDDTVARAAASVVACLAGSVACHAVYLQKHKGQIKGSARVLQRIAFGNSSVLRPITSRKEVAASFDGLLAQLPARHKFYLHQGRGKGWQGAAARASDAAINKLRRRVASSPSASPRSSLLPLLVVAASTAGFIYAWQHREALVAKADELLPPEASAALHQGLESLDRAVGTAAEAMRPHVDTAWESVRPHVENVHETVRPHLEMASKHVNGLIEQAGRQPYVNAIAAKLQVLLSSAGLSSTSA